jgi:alpha-beta hydrolase superfamily lysophospholipase
VITVRCLEAIGPSGLDHQITSFPDHMPKFADKYFRSRDGLKLYYRDYAGDPSKAPVLYLPGLTRNSSDFHRGADHIAPGRRVICADQRGRGRSQYDLNWLNYHPGMYVDDMSLASNVSWSSGLRWVA